MLSVASWAYDEEEGYNSDWIRADDHEGEIHDLKETVLDLVETMLVAQKEHNEDLEQECIQDLFKLLRS